MLRWVPGSLHVARRRLRALRGRPGVRALQRGGYGAGDVAQRQEAEAQGVEAEVQAAAQEAPGSIDPEHVARRVLTLLLRDAERAQERIGYRAPYER